MSARKSPLADTVSFATGLLVMLGATTYYVLQIWAPIKLSTGRAPGTELT